MQFYNGQSFDNDDDSSSDNVNAQDEYYVDDGNVVITDNIAAILLALTIKSETEFQAALELNRLFQQNNQLSVLTKATKDSEYMHSLYSQSRKLSGLSRFELLNRLANAKLVTSEDRMGYFKAVLHEAGDASCVISSDGKSALKLSLCVKNSVLALLEDPSTIINSVGAQIQACNVRLAKTYEHVFRTHPLPGNQIDFQANKLLQDIVGWFFLGADPCEITIARPEAFAPPKVIGEGDLGCGETDVSIATVASQIASDCFNAMAVFTADSAPDCNHTLVSDVSSYVCVSNDSTHPFYHEWAPSIFMKDSFKKKKWQWRVFQEKAAITVSAQLEHDKVDMENSVFVTARQQKYDAMLLDIAQEYALGDDVQPLRLDLSHPYDKLPPSWQYHEKITHRVSFFRRGVSTADEVFANPNVMHFVRHTIVETCVTKRMIPYLVFPVSLVVLLVPSSLHRAVTPQGKKPGGWLFPSSHLLVPYPGGIDMRGMGVLSGLVVAAIRSDPKLADHGLLLEKVSSFFERGSEFRPYVSPLLFASVKVDVYLHYFSDVLKLILRPRGQLYVKSVTSKEGRKKIGDASNTKGLTYINAFVSEKISDHNDISVKIPKKKKKNLRKSPSLGSFNARVDEEEDNFPPDPDIIRVEKTDNAGGSDPKITRIDETGDDHGGTDAQGDNPHTTM